MEYTPKEKLSVKQIVIPLKGSTAEIAYFFMVARDDLVELIEIKIDSMEI